MKFDLKYGEKIFLHKVSLFSFIIIVILHIIVAKNLFVKSNYLLIDISQPTSCSPAPLAPLKQRGRIAGLQFMEI